MRSRFERVTDSLDDQEAYLAKWRFSMAPSEIRKRERAIAKTKVKLDRLLGRSR